MKSKKLIIPAVIVVIFLVATFLSQSKTNLLYELRGPKAGVAGVFTSGDKLTVVSGENEVYGWDWNDLKKWPTVARLKTEHLCPLAPDKIVMISTSTPGTLVVTDLAGEEDIKTVPLPFGTTCDMLVPSPDCSHVSLLLERGGQGRLAVLTPDLELSEITTIDKEDMTVFKVGVSNDGRFVAAAGEKDGGVAQVFDTQTKEAVFKKHLKDITRFDNVIFSPDSTTVYFGERVRFIYAFDIATGDLLRTYEIPKYPPVPQKKQVISAIDISPDGSLLAASTEPVQKLYLWNTQTGEKTAEFGLPGPVVGDIAFSPDSEMIATSVIVRSTISIWKTTGAQ
jgi:WD40 repeat protein